MIDVYVPEQLTVADLVQAARREIAQFLRVHWRLRSICQCQAEEVWRD